MCSCAVGGGSCEHISLFRACRLEQLQIVKSQACVIAEPWEEESRSGQAAGSVRLCVGLWGLVNPELGLHSRTH